MGNDSQLVRWRSRYCCHLVIPSALSPTSWRTRLLFTILSSCPIRGRREPISREVMLGNSGEPFSGFCSCPARHASSRDTTTVQTAGGPLGKAPLLPRGLVHLKNCDESKFVKLRTERDRSLPMPALMLSALQVNLAGGRLPPPESDGRRYLKIPLNTFPQASWVA